MQPGSGADCKEEAVRKYKERANHVGVGKVRNERTPDVPWQRKPSFSPLPAKWIKLGCLCRGKLQELSLSWVSSDAPLGGWWLTPGIGHSQELRQPIQPLLTWYSHPAGTVE